MKHELTELKRLKSQEPQSKDETFQEQSFQNYLRPTYVQTRKSISREKSGIEIIDAPGMFNKLNKSDQRVLLQELEHALRLSYEHPFLGIQRELAAKCSLKINHPSNLSLKLLQKGNSLKYDFYANQENPQSLNYNQKQKVIDIFRLDPTHNNDD